MFRQDYRINKIFLPFQKKGKKHPLLIPRSFFYAEAELCFLGFIWKPWKKIKSILLILSENILALCLENNERKQQI